MRGALGATLLGLVAAACADFDGAYADCVSSRRCREAGNLRAAPSPITLVTAAGTPARQTLTLANVTPLAVGALSFRLDDGQGAFRVEKNTCAALSLGPGESCTLDVVFASLVPDTRFGGLQATADPGGAVEVPIEGRALESVSRSLRLTGSGQGEVRGSFGTCTRDCLTEIVKGSSLELAAEAAVGSAFTGWGGACQGSATTCQLSAFEPTVVSAGFAASPAQLTVELPADAGTLPVSFTPDGADCGPGCRRYPAATDVTVSIGVFAPLGVESWAGCTRAAGLDCMVRVVGDTRVAPRVVRASRAFVTRRDYPPGSLGGVTGANLRCQGEASDAGLEGAFRAWVAAGGLGPASSVPDDGPWVRVDGLWVAGSVASLSTGKVLYPLRVDPAGTDRRAVRVVTGTDGHGGVGASFIPGAATCSDWTSTAIIFAGPTAGSAAFTDSQWAYHFDSQTSGLTCAVAGALYCLEVGRRVAVAAPPPPPGALRAFVTQGVWPGDLGGLAGADERCRDEARDAGLGGTFVAWLAGADAGPGARLEGRAGPWYRSDGARLGTAATLSGGVWETSLNVTGRGAYLDEAQVWVGSGGWGGAGSSSCGQWSSTSDAGYVVQAAASLPFTVAPSGSSWRSERCSSRGALFCFEL